jgi:predicted DNA-binding transcriptional regulator AlpA
VPLATVYDWNSKGTGPRYFKAGRHVRYRLADVERWERLLLEQHDRPEPRPAKARKKDTS